MDQLKVFISSTQKDMQAERDCVEAEIQRLGHLCLRAETYDSPGTSPEEACRAMARECDIYIGVFGSRYGFKVPALGVSATEMEFCEARKHKSEKVFIYVKEVDDVEHEQEIFLNDVQDFSRGYFRHGKFDDCDELVIQIRHDVTTWTTRQIRKLCAEENENKALRDKVAYLSRVMENYGVPEYLR